MYMRIYGYMRPIFQDLETELARLCDTETRN